MTWEHPSSRNAQTNTQHTSEIAAVRDRRCQCFHNREGFASLDHVATRCTAVADIPIGSHWCRCCLRPKIMEVTMALLLTCIAPCRLQHRHRCLKLQMDGILGLRWYWMYWYTSTWMNRHVFLDQALLNAFHIHSVILCLLNTRYNNIIW